MNIEFRLPILPLPGFYSQVRLFALSLSRLGPPYSTATIKVSIGDNGDAARIAAENPWSKGLPIEWTAPPAELCAQNPHTAAGRWRYHAPSDADVVIMCDADTCVLRRFDDILEQLDQPLPCVAGLQAHSPPFRVDHDETWRPLLALVGKTDKALAHSYSLDVRDRWEKGPVYFNYGFVFFNRAAFKQLAPLMDKYLSLALEGLGDNRLVAQVALTLALLGEDIKTVFLKHEYNCANDHILVGYKLVDLEDIRVIHYLRERDLKRREFLTERAAYRAFVDTPKANAVDERLRQLVLSFPELGSEFGGPPQAKPSRLGQTVVRNLLGNLVRRLRA